jgi:hypothetical protein
MVRSGWCHLPDLFAVCLSARTQLHAFRDTSAGHGSQAGTARESRLRRLLPCCHLSRCARRATGAFFIGGQFPAVTPGWRHGDGAVSARAAAESEARRVLLCVGFGRDFRRDWDVLVGCRACDSFGPHHRAEGSTYARHSQRGLMIYGALCLHFFPAEQESQSWAMEPLAVRAGRLAKSH